MGERKTPPTSDRNRARSPTLTKGEEMEEKCESCRFAMNESTYCICRFLPPVSTIHNTPDGYGGTYEDFQASQPITNKEDWCGQWKPKE